MGPRRGSTRKRASAERSLRKGTSTEGSAGLVASGGGHQRRGGGKGRRHEKQRCLLNSASSNNLEELEEEEEEEDRRTEEEDEEDRRMTEEEGGSRREGHRAVASHGHEVRKINPEKYSKNSRSLKTPKLQREDLGEILSGREKNSQENSLREEEIERGGGQQIPRRGALPKMRGRDRSPGQSLRRGIQGGEGQIPRRGTLHCRGKGTGSPRYGKCVVVGGKGGIKW